MKNLTLIISSFLLLLLLSNCEKCDYVETKCQDCPVGFTRNVANDNCEIISSQIATFNGTLFNIVKANQNQYYSIDGAKLYNFNFTATNTPVTSNTAGLEDNAANPIPSSTPLTGFWTNRLNDCGVWASGVGFFQWVGFSECVTVDVDTKVCIGIGSDNRCRFTINGITPNLVEMNNSNIYNFTTWHVFEFTLLAGSNIITMEGLNDNLFASFGAEIYKASFADVQTWTSVSQLEDALIFSTKDQVGTPFQTGVASGYSCPNGLALDFCSGDSVPICSSIQRVNYLPCQGVPITIP